MKHGRSVTFTKLMKKNPKYKEQQMKLLGIGSLDLEFSLNLTEIECKLYNISHDTVSCLSNFETLLTKNAGLIDKIIIISNNPLVNSLIFLNRSLENKVFIEYLTLSKIEFSSEAMFMSDICKYSCNHSYLFLNENDICDWKNEISFSIKIPKRDKITFSLSKEKEKSSIEDEVEEKPQGNLISRLICEFSEFNYLFLNLNDYFTISASENSSSKDLVKEILGLVKILWGTYNINIIIDFQQMFINLNKYRTDQFILMIKEFLAYADVMIIDLKDTLSFHKLVSISDSIEDLHSNQCYPSSRNQNKQPNSTNSEIIKFFLNDVGCKQRFLPNEKKILLIFDELSKIVLKIKSPENKIIYETEYIFHLAPKICHTNVELIEHYKTQTLLHCLELKSVFLGCFFGRIVNKISLYSAFLAGQEMTRKILELYRTSTPLFTNPDFYIITIKKTDEGNKYFEDISKKKESRFILDCLNVITSKMSMYDPYQDKSLRNFFASSSVVKHLKNHGYIDQDGSLLDRKKKIIKKSKYIKLPGIDQYSGANIHSTRLNEDNNINTLLQRENANMGDELPLENNNSKGLPSFWPSNLTYEEKLKRLMRTSKFK